MPLDAVGREACRRGPHYASPSGVVAGCADCHVPHHGGEPNAAQYLAMEFYKAKVGTRDAIAQVRGVDSLGGRQRLADVPCDDPARMGGGKAQAPLVEMHAGLAQHGEVECVDCHQATGHVYETPPKPAASQEERVANPLRRSRRWALIIEGG